MFGADPEYPLYFLLTRSPQSMVGSDIAELLMEDCKKLDQYKPQPSVTNLISLGDEDWPVLSSGTPNLLTGEIPPSVETPAQAVEKFTKLLYFGRKKASVPLQGLSSPAVRTQQRSCYSPVTPQVLQTEAGTER